MAAVTATLSHPSGEALTVSVSALAVLPAVAGDFTLSAARTLTIAAGATTSTGAVTVTANIDGDDTPNEQVTVTGTASGANGAADPADETLTIVDADGDPQVVLALSRASIAEGGAAAVVTATLSPAASTAVTVRVTTTAVPPAVAADLTRSAADTLFFAAGATTSTGAVTISATDDDRDEADGTATVSGTASGGGALDPAPLTLAIVDDDDPPTVSISPASVTEGNAGSATLSLPVTLSGASGKLVTVEYEEESGGTATPGTDYEALAPGRLTFTAGETSRTVDVTVTGDATDEPNETVRVTLSLPVNAMLGTATGTGTITDDDVTPTATLALSNASISENRGTATVTAALSHPASVATTITVTAAAVSSSGAGPGDFTQTGTTLTIAAGSTTSTGTVTVTAKDNAVDAPDKRVRVSGTAAGGRGVAAPRNVTLTLADDEATPTVTLSLAPSSITEAGGVSTVTAGLSGASSEAVTVTVTTTPVAPAVAGNFTQRGTTLAIAAGSTTSTGTVTITARNNAVDAADAEVAVAGTTVGGNGAANPRPATLTLEDDDRPAVTLVLSPSSIPEGGFSTVTARLSGPARAAVTITVATAPGANTAQGDFTVSDAKTLIITAGMATSTGEVTIRGRLDSRDSPDKTVTVTGTGASAGGTVDVTGAALTVTDDDPTPTVALVFTRSGQQTPITSIAENGGVASVTASLSGGQSGEAIEITVSATAGGERGIGRFRAVKREDPDHRGGGNGGAPAR